MMKIAAIQITSGLDYQTNLSKIRRFLTEAKQNKVEAVFLPEVFYSITNGLETTPYLIEGQNDHYLEIQKLAIDYQLYILGGSAATKVDGKVTNRSFNFAPDGTDLGFYDKINLFACDLTNDPTKLTLDEGRLYTAGSQTKMIDVKDFKLGLSICFDLRFPELFRYYSFHGADLFSISSAFTQPTGKAHWHVLVRARAIENQCYVVATGQWGIHNERVSTYGHSLIVDPWGEVIADAGEGERIIYAEISKERLQEIRQRMKVRKDPRVI